MSEELALFFGCLLSGLGIPVPEDVPLLLAGWGVRTGAMDPLVAGVLAYVAVLCRDTIGFSVGRWLRRGVQGPRMQRLFPPERMARLQDMVERYGSKAHWFGRFAVGARVSMFLVAGLAGVRYRNFFLADGLALLITTPLFLWLGWRFGQDAVDFLQDQVQGRVLWVLLGLVLAAVVTRRVRLMRANRSEAAASADPA